MKKLDKQIQEERIEIEKKKEIMMNSLKVYYEHALEPDSQQCDQHPLERATADTIKEDIGLEEMKKGGSYEEGLLLRRLAQKSHRRRINLLKNKE